MARSYGLVPWGGGELDQEMAEGPPGVRGLRGRCGAVGGEQEAACPAAGDQDLGGGLGEKRRLPSFTQRVPVGARYALRPPLVTKDLF